MTKDKKKHHKAIKKFYWKLHHWVGLYTGILIGVLSLTGALAVFIPEIDSYIKKQHYRAFSTPYPGENPAFSQSLSSLTTQFPDFQSLTVHLPDTPEDVVVLEMAYPDNGEALRYEFFVDGGRDEILGRRLWQNSTANFLRQVHVRLYEGNWGRQLVGIGGIGLFMVSLTGLLIYGNFMKRQKWPEVRKGLNMRIQMADWHKIFGVSALAFNVVIALTGAWLGLQPWLMQWFNISVPNQHVIERVIAPEDDARTTIEWDQIFQSVSQNFPELTPSRFDVSTDGTAVIRVRGDVRGQVYERNANMIVLSKANYRPVFRYNVEEQPFSHKLYYVQEALHFGNFGGIGLKILYAFLGLTSGFLSISGFVVFLYRKNKKNADADQRTRRAVFLVCTLGLLLLATIAFISINLGYALAASFAEILINGLLIISALYLVINFLIKNRRRRKSDNNLPPS